MIVITKDNIEQLAWDKMDDMLPCVVQHGYSGSMQMLGYMNRDAVLKTLETGFVTFFSRSKQRLWTKGETSGHTLDLIQLSADCDYDAILAIAKPNGPTCHLGNPTCWDEAIAPDMTFLAELEKVLAERKNADPDSSYTAKLYQRGIKRIAQKVGEEGVETALAATVGDKEELKNEAADLLYHLIVLLQASDMSLKDAIDVLKDRHK